MKSKGLKRLMSICLSLCIVCTPLLANAQEKNQDVEKLSQQETAFIQSDFVGENANESVSSLQKSDLYEEVAKEADDIEEYAKNNMDRQYAGKELSITKLPKESRSTVAKLNAENTDPNYAYLVENGDIVQGNLTQTGEMRWYGFILNQTSKVSIMLEAASSVDADLYVFKLDENTYNLDLIGGSASTGIGIMERYSSILGAGIYYFAIDAYEGNGQYTFAFYATNDLNNEVNDTVATAATIGVNSTVTGVIDNPYDIDYYKFTLTAPMIMSMSKTVGNYKFDFLLGSSSAGIYRVSQTEELYEFEAGTYYIRIYSPDGSYSVNTQYSINLNKIANIAADANSFCYMVNKPAKIVFQTDPNGGRMYVNGNPIDVSYSYYNDASNSAGTQIYDISMQNSSKLRAKIYQDQFMYDDWETTAYFAMTMPDTVRYLSGNRGVGPTGIEALQLSIYTSDASNFYKIHCRATGAYAANNLNRDLFFATVLINPNTGKLVDIEYYNYYYDYIGGSNSMTYTRPYGSHTKYYYPYYNGEEPTTW